MYKYFDNQDFPIKVHANDRNNQVISYVSKERSPIKNANEIWQKDCFWSLWYEKENMKTER